MAWPWLSVTVTHQVDLGLRAAAAARSRARSGSTGPIPPSSPGRSARPVTVASGTVKVTCPANPGGIIPASGPPGAGAGGRAWGGLGLGWVLGRAGAAVPSARLPSGRESMPSKMSR